MPHRDACPIDAWPDEPSFVSVDWPAEVDLTDRTRSSPTQHRHRLADGRVAGHNRPCPVAQSGPASGYLDELLLARPRLDSKRLVFLTETLAELAEGHDPSSGSATRSTNSSGAASPSPMPPCPALLIEHGDPPRRSSPVAVASRAGFGAVAQRLAQEGRSAMSGVPATSRSVPPADGRWPGARRGQRTGRRPLLLERLPKSQAESGRPRPRSRHPPPALNGRAGPRSVRAKRPRSSRPTTGDR